MLDILVLDQFLQKLATFDCACSQLFFGLCRGLPVCNKSVVTDADSAELRLGFADG